MNWYRFLQTLTAIGALMIVIGLVAGLFGFLDSRKAQRAAEWPSVPGTITDSEIYTAEIRGRGVRLADAVRIRYSYFVDGSLFFNDRVNVESLVIEANTDLGQRLLREYQDGMTVPVHYDPADPASSVLEIETPASAYSAAQRLVVVGAVVLGLRWLLRKRPYHSSQI